MATQESSSIRLGWRFAVGLTLVVGGYAAWSLIPVAVATDLHPGTKSVLTALLGATPFFTKVAAVMSSGSKTYCFREEKVKNEILSKLLDENAKGFMMNGDKECKGNGAANGIVRPQCAFIAAHSNLQYSTSVLRTGK